MFSQDYLILEPISILDARCDHDRGPTASRVSIKRRSRVCKRSANMRRRSYVPTSAERSLPTCRPRQTRIGPNDLVERSQVRVYISTISSENL